jgi:pilus assembly protein Flp/PilA
MSEPTTEPRPLVARLRLLIVADERGATAIEYAMVAAGVGLAVATTVWSVGSTIKTNFYDAIAAMF